MGDVVIACPETGCTVKTGWVMPSAVLGQSVVFAAVLDPCPACGRRHTWTPADAWVVGTRPHAAGKAESAAALPHWRVPLRRFSFWLAKRRGNAGSS
jgi:hypothetical protein